MELNPLKNTRTISWWLMRLTHTDGIAHGAVECLVPSHRAQTLLRGAGEQARLRDETILRGVGELALQVQRGRRRLDYETMHRVWQAVVEGDGGAELNDVFDPHEVHVLRATAPELIPEITLPDE